MDVLIAGGGLAGLACAMALRGTGLRVTLVEQASVLGGRARSWRDSRTGDMIDIGPHIITTHHHNFLELLEQCATTGHIAWQRTPLITLLDADRAIDISLAPLPAPLSLLPAFMRAHRLTIGQRLSNVRPTWEAMRFDERDVPSLDRQDAASYLRGLGVAPAAIDWFWRSICMVVLNVPLEQCSAAALMRCYAQLCGHSGYCFGFPKDSLAGLYLPAVPHLLAAAGTSIRLKTALSALRFDQGRCVGAILADGTVVGARFIVCALPPLETDSLLPGLPRWSSFEPSQYLCVYLWFDRRITGSQFWTQVWSRTAINYDFYDLANIRDWPPHRGSLIASNVIHAQRLPAMSDEEVIAATVRELSRHVKPGSDLRPIHACVHRVAMAVPCPAPGTETQRPTSAIPSMPGVILAGDWTRTGLPACMESAVRSGRLAAEEVLRQCGRPLDLALPPPATTGLAGMVRSLRQLAANGPAVK